MTFAGADARTLDPSIACLGSARSDCHGHGHQGQRAEPEERVRWRPLVASPRVSLVRGCSGGLPDELGEVRLGAHLLRHQLEPGGFNARRHERGVPSLDPQVRALAYALDVPERDVGPAKWVEEANVRRVDNAPGGGVDVETPDQHEERGTNPEVGASKAVPRSWRRPHNQPRESGCRASKKKAGKGAQGRSPVDNRPLGVGTHGGVGLQPQPGQRDALPFREQSEDLLSCFLALSRQTPRPYAPRYSEFDLADFRDQNHRVMLMNQESCR